MMESAGLAGGGGYAAGGGGVSSDLKYWAVTGADTTRAAANKIDSALIKGRKICRVFVFSIDDVRGRAGAQKRYIIVSACFMACSTLMAGTAVSALSGYACGRNQA